MRALALDLGTKRIGVAVSDASGTLASPRPFIGRAGDEADDHARVRSLVNDEEVEVVVVGLPLSMDGRERAAAAGVRGEAARLAAAVNVPVVLHDERLTTVQADRALRAAGHDGRRRRTAVDSAAATVLLQSWLDAGRPGAPTR